MGNVSRRAAMTGLSAAILQNRYRVFALSPTAYSARAIRLIEETPTVDLLNQFRFPDFRENLPDYN